MGDYVAFKKQIADLDRRLASIINQAFDDCSGVESTFKVGYNRLRSHRQYDFCLLYHQVSFSD